VPVVEAGGAGVCVPGQVPHVLARDVLLKEVCDGGDTEGMGRVEQGQAEVLQAALHHAVDIVAVDPHEEQELPWAATAATMAGDIIHAAACGLSFHHLGKEPTPAVPAAH